MKVWQIIVMTKEERFIENLILMGQPTVDRLRSYLEYLSVCDDEETESIVKQYEDQFECCVDEMGDSILVCVCEMNVLFPDIPARYK